MSNPSKNKQSKILTLLFIALVLAAAGYVGWHTVFSELTDRRHAQREVPQLRADVVAELEQIGLARSPVIGEQGAIRFGYPPTMSSDDILLLLRQIIQKFNLNLTSAVKYEEKRELYIELSSEKQQMVARLLFAPGRPGEMLAGAVRGRIGLIIDDFGYFRNRLTAGFMSLNERITFSIIPGHRYSQVLADEAIRSGHEVIIHMPMEPENYNGRDEEEYILLYGMDEDEVVSRIRRALQEISPAVGMNNHEGSLATLDTVLLDILAMELKKRNMYFVDSYTTPATRALDIMQQREVPSKGRLVFLDNEDNPAYIRRQLSHLAAYAERTGSAIGIGHASARHANTLEVLQEEIPKLKNRGFEFVFISELLK